MLIRRRIIFCDYDETETRLPFYRSFSTFWSIFSGLCTQGFHSLTWIRGDLKSVVSQNQKSCFQCAATTKCYLVSLTTP